MRPIALKLEKPTIVVTVDQHAGTVTLKTDKLAKDVYLSVDDLDVKFSDNYFDLLPGTFKSVSILNGINVSKIQSRINIISLYDSYAH